MLVSRVTATKTQHLVQRFAAQYAGDAARVYRAPGRVNLIGEHTDYNDGFVMPVAIDFSTWVAISPRPDRLLRVYSENFAEQLEFDLDESPPPRHHWSDYVRGVALELERAGHRLRGANLLIDGEVPIGSGLSSSAALEVSAGYALLENAGCTVNRVEMARICQRAENEFVGMRCGIMDQFISCLGRSDQALLLDCRSLEYRALPLGPGVRIVISNTMITHELANTEYNVRRTECEAGVRTMGRSLRDVSLEDLRRAALPEKIYRRCRHVITENARVLEAGSALERHDLVAFGRLMGESHRSLRDDFEVSCAELDLMVDIAGQIEGVYGARMTGGGFGGCTVNLVRTDKVEDFRRAVLLAYTKAAGRVPVIYVTSAVEGGGEVRE